MTHNLRNQGLHSLYRMMVEHEDIINGKSKKTDVVALFCKQGEIAPSKGKMQRKDASSGDDAALVANSTESGEDIRMLNEDMALMARDIQKMNRSLSFYENTITPFNYLILFRSSCSGKSLCNTPKVIERTQGLIFEPRTIVYANRLNR